MIKFCMRCGLRYQEIPTDFSYSYYCPKCREEIKRKKKLGLKLKASKTSGNGSVRLDK